MTETGDKEIKSAAEVDAPGGDGHTTASPLTALKPDAKEPVGGSRAGSGASGGTQTEAGPGTSGGVGSPGDQTGAAEIDTLRDSQGEVPLPAGLKEHAPIPGRRSDDKS